MYKELEAQMARRGLKREHLAKVLGVTYGTIGAKLRGESAFTFSEAVKVKECLNFDGALEELFKK